MMKSIRDQRMLQLIIFIFVVLICGWIGFLVDTKLQEQPTGNTPGMLIFITVPFLTVIIIRSISRDWHDFGFKPRFKGNLKWYVVGLIIFPIVTILVSGVALLFDLIEFSNFDISIFSAVVVASLLPSMIINILEEFAWRGYLTPKLIELKMNDWLIYVIVGLVWALWHAPYYLVLMPDAYFETFSRMFALWSGCIIMVCWSVMFVELYRITGSVWPGVLLHAIQDSFPNLLINNIGDGGVIVFAKTIDPWLNPTYGIITTLLIVAIGLWLRTVRIKKERISNHYIDKSISG